MAYGAEQMMSLTDPHAHMARSSLTKAVSVAWGAAPRFFRNAAISFPTFLLDLGLLFLLTQRVHLNYLLATVLSFLISNGLNYFLARRLVFTGTKRGLRAGLVYFLVIAALAAVTLTPLMWLLAGVCHLDVLLSRTIAAIIVGVGGYLMNLVLNFRVGGSKTSPARADIFPNN